MDIIGATNFDFIGKRKLTFAISSTLVLIGLFSVVQIARGAANLGIDFAGGVTIQLRFEKDVSIEKAREILREGNLPPADLQQFAEANRLLVRLKTHQEDIGPLTKTLIERLQEGFKDNKATVEGTTEIGPSVGRRLQKDALWAVFISMMGIIVYIAFRFEWKFGVAAAIATLHDVLAVLGIFFLMGREVNLLVVTSLLTLAGYSLTDTVVVFDRIRENLRLRAKVPLAETVNKSINEVLRRTIVTSSTVLLVLVALILFGGEVTYDFALALFMGVIVGTYSSVYLASPIIVVWKVRAAERRPAPRMA